jgi:hypothetical protein
VGIISLFLAFIIYVLLQSYLTKHKYKAKYDIILNHLGGLDLPPLQVCNVLANEDGLIFVAGDKETRIDRGRLYRLGVYSEHDLKRGAAEDKLEIGALDGLVKAIPRQANSHKDIYVVVINYYDRLGEIAVAGLFNDVLVRALEIFAASVNVYYGLRQEVVEIVPTGGTPPVPPAAPVEEVSAEEAAASAEE